MIDVNLLFNSSSEIFHHGIEGQKWGVRNGPPYPLDRDNAGRIVRERKEKLARAQEGLDRTKIKKSMSKGATAGTIIGAAAAIGDNSIGGLSTKSLNGSIDGKGDFDISLSSIITMASAPVIGALIGRYAASGKDKAEYKQATNEVKQANREVKLAKQYVKLAQQRRLSNSEYEKLAELKKELNLK